MSAVGGVVGGVLALTLLEATLAGSEADGGGAVAGGLTLVAGILRHVLDPAVPLIPDLRNKSTTNKPAAYIQPPVTTGQAAPPATAPTTIPA